MRRGGGSRLLDGFDIWSSLGPSPNEVASALGRGLEPWQAVRRSEAREVDEGVREYGWMELQAFVILVGVVRISIS